jgi:hypothetical protein
MKPIIKFNGAIGALLCNDCSVIIKDHLTKDEFEGKTPIVICKKCLDKKISDYQTKNKEGFTNAEIMALLQEFPTINMKAFEGSMLGHTCIIKDNELVMYHIDIFHALVNGLGLNTIKLG